jgi:hypothetical protein
MSVHHNPASHFQLILEIFSMISIAPAFPIVELLEMLNQKLNRSPNLEG